MRIFKSLLVSLIGPTALMYALENLASISGLRKQIAAIPSGANVPAISWAGFALITLCQFAIAAVAF